MQPAWMHHAWRHFGVHEAAGDADNPVIVAFYRDAGHASVRDDEVPWCAAFVGACLARSGTAATGSLRARSYMDWGVAVDTAHWGAVAVLSRGTNPRAGHVGFVVGETRDHIWLLGGNQSNAVTVARFPRSRLLGLRMSGVASADGDVQSGVTATDDAFDAALAHVLRMEGGYTHDPHDPGGPTNKGITLATYARHRGTEVRDGNRAALIADLKAITDDTVAQIYRTRYWRLSRAADMPRGVHLMHFDASVNHGHTGAARILQTALNVTVDGEIGPITLGAARAADPAELIARYAELRADRYRELHHFWRFGRGWLNRVNATRNAALAAHRKSQTSPAKSGGQNVSTPEPEQTNPPVEEKWWGESLTIRGVLLTFLSTVLPVAAPLFGLEITTEMIAQIGTHATALLQAIGGLAGIALTIFGRTRATARLTRLPMQVRV